MSRFEFQPRYQVLLLRGHHLIQVTKEPRPIGDSIYFFQDRVRNATQTSIYYWQENAFQLADFRSMDLTLEDHLIPRELWNEYGIPSILKQKRKSGKNEDFRDLEAVDEDDDFVSQETSEQIEDVEEDITTVADHGNRKKIIYKGKEYIEDLDDDDKESVILKANSGQ